MPPIRDEAVCLRRWDFSETSQTVCLFTREHGILRGLAKGAKRDRGRFSGGFDVLCRGEIVAFLKSGRELANLAEWTLRDTARSLRLRLAAHRAGMVMADLLAHLFLEHDPHPTVYDALVAALARLERPGEEGVALLELLWAALSEAGFAPELDVDVRSRAPLDTAAEPLGFDPRAGGVTAAPDLCAWPVRRATIAAIRAAAAGIDPEDAAAATRGARLLAAFAREVLGRDLPSLRWCFPDLPAPLGTAGGGRVEPS